MTRDVFLAAVSAVGMLCIFRVIFSYHRCWREHKQQMRDGPILRK